MRLLIIDDDENVRSSIVKFLDIQGYRSEGANGAQEAQHLLNREAFDAILLDLRMPGMDGLDFLRWLKEEGFQIPVIMISAHGEIRDAVEALKLGAKDYLTKPFDPEELIIRVKRIEEVEKLRKLGRDQISPGNACFWGSSAGMKSLKADLGRAAATDATILLLGESGTGKEVTARWIHAQSPRRDQAFLALNLGSLNEALVESELFGHEKGAFTGADSLRRGIFESAQGGTVFLDELGELPLRLQPTLLRVLQEGMVRRLGNSREFPVDVRIIAATNRDLSAMVAEGTFREDLYYRLSVIPFTLPPLRDRIQDLPELVEILLERVRKRIGSRPLSIEEDALSLLRNYRFPGNIRELENLLERWAILSPERKIGAQDVAKALFGGETPDSSDRKGQETQARAGGSPVFSGTLSPGSLREAEREAIRYWLSYHGGNRTRAAKDLGISRKTLISKIADYGLEGDRDGRTTKQS